MWPVSPGPNSSHYVDTMERAVRLDWFSSVYPRLQLSERPLVNISNNFRIYGFHPGGVVMARLDGSVFFLDETTDKQVLLDMLARANGR